MSLLSELKRRRVIRILIVYAGAAWVFIEGASVLLPVFNAPVWVLRLLVMVVVLGFPVAFILSWVFDITPDGIHRTAPKSKRGVWTILGAVFLMTAGTTGIYFLTDPGRSQAAQNTVAVLACSNWSSDPEFEYFSDGLAEDIINRLSRLRDINVIARQSSFTFKEKNSPIPEIGKLLDVAHVLVCSVRKSDQGIRVSAQLVDTQTNLHIWSTVFNRSLADTFHILDEISVDVADSILIKLVGEDRAELVRHDTESVEALQFYMKGRFFFEQITLESLQKSVHAFEQALGHDPEFALAYLGLADTLWMQEQMEQIPHEEIWPRIESLLNKALELDSDLGEAYAILGLNNAIVNGNWDKGRRQLQRALELKPNSSIVRMYYAQLLMTTGPRWEAIEHAEISKKINPLGPFAADNVIAAYYHTRDYERSLEEVQVVLMQHPHHWVAYWMMGWNLAGLGRTEEAIAAYERAIEISEIPSEIIPDLGFAYAMAGRLDEAKRILQDLITKAETEYVSSTSFVLLYLGLNDYDAAIEWLQKALDEADPRLMSLHEHYYDPVRNDPRFRAIVRAYGLDPDSID